MAASGAAVRVGEHKMDEISQTLAEIDGGIRQLKVDFDRFFNGALPVPPEDQRRRLTKLLRRARSMRSKTFADRFMLNTLEARFNTLSELFNRRLREQETTGSARPHRPVRELDPSRGVVLGSSMDLEAVTALYNRLYSSAGRRAKTDFDSFQSYLRKQVDTLRQRTGCREIRFRVAQTGGEPKLKAKPLTVQD